MKPHRPTIKDIANALNMSVTSVSFVLNCKGKERKISDKVINKILTYINKIGFTTKSVAQSLRSEKSKILVFILRFTPLLFRRRNNHWRQSQIPLEKL